MLHSASVTQPDILVQRAGALATVVFNRPDVRNAISLAMWAELARVTTELAKDDAVRAIVFRGAGTLAFGLSSRTRNTPLVICTRLAEHHRATNAAARVASRKWIARASLRRRGFRLAPSPSRWRKPTARRNSARPCS